MTKQMQMKYHILTTKKGIPIPTGKTIFTSFSKVEDSSLLEFEATHKTLSVFKMKCFQSSSPPVTRKKFTLESILALVFKNQVRLKIGLLLYKEGINFSKEGLSLLENPVFHKAKPIREYSTPVNHVKRSKLFLLNDI